MLSESDHLQRLKAALGQRYRIERELGAGGSATVYLADDLKHGRQVALKVLRPELAAAIGAERFLREIKTTANLQHPHILALYDSGEDAGVLFYVMPYIAGETLRDRLNREKRLSQPDSIRIVRQVADALAYAHGRDIVHRDIKPENILLDGEQTYVSDFGIARAVSSASETSVTQTGTFVGTPLYISPEQASGELDLDGRSDLYSLACVLFEMLAGEPPFTGATAEAVLVQRFTQPPPRLSDTVGGASPEIDAALYRAMTRDPSDRFSGVLPFVEACTSSTPVSGLAAKSVAVLPFVNIGSGAEDEFFADGVTEEIINALAQFKGLRVAARTSSFAFKGTSQDLRLIGEKLNVAAVLEGSLRRSGSRLRVTAQLVEVANGYQLWSERFDRELTDVFAVQEEIASSIASAMQILLTDKGDERPARPATSNLDCHVKPGSV